MNAPGTGETADRTAVVVAVLASFVAFLDGSVVNLALPAMARDLDGGLALQQWAIDGYLLTLGALILVAGAVSDRYGLVAILRLGLLVFAAASMACALAPSGALLIAARCAQGLGAAFLVPGSLALINTRFVGARQARAIGTWSAWTGTAFLVGPPIGGVLVDALNWRWVFALNVVPVAVTLLLVSRLAAKRIDRTDPVDGLGALLAAAGLTGTVYALIEEQRLGPSNPVVVSALVVGVCCLIGFGWWERRAAHPMMPPSLFTRRNFVVGNVSTTFFYAGVSLGTLLVSLFLQETAGFTATRAGLATLPIPVLSFLLARSFGTLAGRHGPRLFMATGPVVAAAGFLLMRGAHDDFDFWTQLLPGLLVYGLGLSITVSPLTAAVLAAVDPAQSGIGSAVNNAVSRIAGLVAVAFLGVVIGGAMDVEGFRRGVVVVAAMFVAAGLCSALGITNAGHDAGRVTVAAAAPCHDRAAPPPALGSVRV